MKPIRTTLYRNLLPREAFFVGLVLAATVTALSTCDAVDAAEPAAPATRATQATDAMAKATAARPVRLTADQARGKYLMSTSACMDCHTPWKLGDKGPEPDVTRLYSGHPEQLTMPSAPKLPEGPWIMTAGATNTAWAGPWGVSFTANLTPDMETGLGRWTEADFIRTIRTGRHMGRGREVLPPMPIAVYNHFSDRDLKAIFAYLRTIPAISNRVPEPVLPSAHATR